MSHSSDMSFFALSSSMDIDSPNYSRWLYATSNARSEPYTPMPKAHTRPEPQPVQRPPPPILPPSPVQTSLGVWEDDDGIYYDSKWPPVQEYLDRIRQERRMLVAPSEIIFVLAALDVVDSPRDIAHWLFWPSATYYSTADRVTRIALSQPRLIVTKVPWIGSREYRWTVNAIQEKYLYVHMRGEWYPTVFQPPAAKKRALRSNGAVEDPFCKTINQYFNIVASDEGLPPAKRQRRPSRKVAESTESRVEVKPLRAQRRNAILTSSVKQSAIPPSVSTSVAIRSNGPVEQASPPLADTATASPTDSQVNPIPSVASDLSSTSSHSRNRSTSQSTATVVAEEQDCRSGSVESASTAVASSSLSRKRKAIVLDETIEATGQPAPTEGMITRGRSKIARISGVSAEPKKTSAPLTPVKRRTKSTAKTKTRKSRSS